VRVALIATVLNEEATLADWLASIDVQSRAPDEVVIVDGGSCDDTFPILRKWAARRPHVTVDELPGANISAGRNRAIESATTEVIAVSDGGSTLESGWLEALVAPFEAGGVEVAMGFYRADPRSLLERLVACLNLPDADEIDPGAFMPSSRSVAFTKEAWERAGRYPEWLDIGEDMYLNLRMVQDGARRVFVPSAVARWRLRADLPSTYRQYYRYAEGDGIAGMWPQRHAIRFATYAAAAGAVLARRPGITAPLGMAAVGWRMRPAYRRASVRLSGPERGLAFLMLPALEVFLDVAKMAGYVAGRRARRV
jgi:glycosyltransferase involved in cell wall biosynthesis